MSSAKRVPVDRMARFRGYPTSRVAARFFALYLETMRRLPALGMVELGRWVDGVEIVKVGSNERCSCDFFLRRPVEGRVSRNDVIFQAAAVAAIVGVDADAVEKWIWTGDPELPSGWRPR